MKRLRIKLGVVVILTLFAMAAGGIAALAQKKPSNPFRSLHGHVFSRDNKPVSKAVVYLKNTKTRVMETYISDADGSYRFPWLSPRADYEVHAEFQGARTDTKFISSFDNRKEFDLLLRLQ